MYAVWDELLYLSALARFNSAVSIHPSYAYLSRRTSYKERTIRRTMHRLERLGLIKRWKQYNKVVNGIKTWFPRDVFISKKGYGSLNAKISDLLGRVRRKQDPLTPPQQRWWSKLFRSEPPRPNKIRPRVDDSNIENAPPVLSLRDHLKIPA